MHATPVSGIAATVAADLAKDVFQLAFAAAPGQRVAQQRLSRTAFAHAFDNVPPRRIVMEACGSAHHWAHHFQRLGHTVTLLPALAVRPYVHGNKTARRLWASEHHRRSFDPNHLSAYPAHAAMH